MRIIMPSHDTEKNVETDPDLKDETRLVITGGAMNFSLRLPCADGKEYHVDNMSTEVVSVKRGFKCEFLIPDQKEVFK